MIVAGVMLTQTDWDQVFDANKKLVHDGKMWFKQEAMIVAINSARLCDSVTMALNPIIVVMLWVSHILYDNKLISLNTYELIDKGTATSHSINATTRTTYGDEPYCYRTSTAGKIRRPSHLQQRYDRILTRYY